MSATPIQTKDLGISEMVVFHCRRNIVTSPLILDRQLDTLIDTLRERHMIFIRNLSGLMFDDILKTDLPLTEYISLADLKFRELP